MATADLFASATYQPLADRLRPQQLSEYLGQQHILAPGKPLFESLQAGQIHSMILWGPPGVGKTTLARLIAAHVDAEFYTLSAVLSGVKDIRAIVATAKMQSRKSILFVDEVHRFNKSQQDAFLPFVEDGTVIFVGATTENPSFELNNALLSRARVYVLKPLAQEYLYALIDKVLCHEVDGDLQLSDKARLHLVQAADGDARRLLNIMEIALDFIEEENGQKSLPDAQIVELVGESARRFDKGGDYFYDQISALHKSVRGSAPDAALYWLARMLDGGCDPLYLCRRVVRMASEDIGNADTRALAVCLDAWNVQSRLGSPEGELALAQAVVYLACAPKSNAVYKAFNEVQNLVKSTPSYDVPEHLRNAPTQLMAELGHGEGYRYAHDEPNAYSAGEAYMPQELHGTKFYQPVERGLEKKIAEKLRYLDQLDKASERQRYHGGDS